MSKICIAIGVSKAERLDPLPGALTAAESLVEWASTLGYRTCLITDEDDQNPVTSDRLKSEIEPLLLDPNEERERIILSFAGHGLISGTRDLWLLDRWYTDPNEIVDVGLMCLRLGTYRPRQVTIVSDACRIPPPADDPTVQGSRVLSRSPWQPLEPDFDMLLATGMGKPAYMVRARENRRAYCLFTQVVTNTLWGRYPDSVDQSRASGPAVTSETLKLVVRRELPLVANLLGQDQKASISTNYSAPDDVYTPISMSEAAPPPVTLEPAPAAAQESSGGGGWRIDPALPGGALGRNFGASDLSYLGDAAERFQLPDLPALILQREPLQTREQVAARFRQDFGEEAPFRPTHFESIGGLALVGERIARVVTGRGVYSEPGWLDAKAPRDSRGRWWKLHGPPGSVAVELAESGRWVCAALYPKMIGTFTIDKNGAASLIYRPSEAHTPPDIAVPSEKAIAALRAGNVVEEDALNLAVELRLQKHAAPVLGVIAAYLYARVGDFESIRKMAWFYCDQVQPIPFDIALLGGLALRREGSRLLADVPKTRPREARSALELHNGFATEATGSSRGKVAGGFPWLRQGWSRLEDSRQVVLEPLSRFEAALTPAMFTTLESQAGRELASLIENGEL